MVRLAPSLLSADFSNLGADIKKIEDAGAHLLHVDVMDGHFVPNISFGATVMKSLQGKTKLPFDVHLMIERPDDYIADFVTEQTEFIIVHEEACIHLNRTVNYIKSFGVKAGVALNPATTLRTLDYMFDDIDLVLVMSVNPGFGGQKFMEPAIEKIKALQSIKKAHNLNFEIEVDGGIGKDNVKRVVEAGATIIVAGSAIFKAEDIKMQTKKILENINKF
ncbi:MAG: ribulose-phosphate 3-epimerase [Eubacteriales bacterium]